VFATGWVCVYRSLTDEPVECSVRHVWSA